MQPQYQYATQHDVVGEVNVGLASHWRCVTDLVIYQSTGSMAIYAHNRYGTLLGCHNIQVQSIHVFVF